MNRPKIYLSTLITLVLFIGLVLYLNMSPSIWEGDLKKYPYDSEAEMVHVRQVAKGWPIAMHLEIMATHSKGTKHTLEWIVNNVIFNSIVGLIMIIGGTIALSKIFDFKSKTKHDPAVHVPPVAAAPTPPPVKNEKPPEARDE